MGNVDGDHSKMEVDLEDGVSPNSPTTRIGSPQASSRYLHRGPGLVPFWGSQFYRPRL